MGAIIPAEKFAGGSREAAVGPADGGAVDGEGCGEEEGECEDQCVDFDYTLLLCKIIVK